MNYKIYIMDFRISAYHYGISRGHFFNNFPKKICRSIFSFHLNRVTSNHKDIINNINLL